MLRPWIDSPVQHKKKKKEGLCSAIRVRIGTMEINIEGLRGTGDDSEDKELLWKKQTAS